MKEVIKNLKLIIRRYKTFIELGKKDYMLKTEELDTIRKAIRYLELIFELSKQYNKGDKE